MSDQCPLYPQKRTLIERVGISALCQKQTSELFDYFVPRPSVSCANRADPSPPVRGAKRPFSDVRSPKSMCQKPTSEVGNGTAT